MTDHAKQKLNAGKVVYKSIIKSIIKLDVMPVSCRPPCALVLCIKMPLCVSFIPICDHSLN